MLTISLALAAPMTPEQAAADLDAIVARLQGEYIHPERVRSPAFLERVASARAALDEVENTRDFWRVASPVVASLDDGHTYLLAPLYREGSTEGLPLEIDIDEGVMYLVAIEGRPVERQPITRIDDRPAAELLEEWRSYFSAEHHGFEDTFWIADDFGSLYPWLTDRTSAEIQLDDGTRHTVSVGPHPQRPPQEPWSWRIEGQLAILAATRFDMPMRPWRKDLKRFFRAVRDASPRAVVLDVRHNPGGDTARVDAILPYLMAPWRVFSTTRIRTQRSGVWGPPVERENQRRTYRMLPPWDGPVYVLTDGATFSTGSDLAMALSDHGRARIVGETPGGMPTSTGNLHAGDLPSGLELYVATGWFERAEPSRGEGPLQIDLPCNGDQALECVLADLSGGAGE